MSTKPQRCERDQLKRATKGAAYQKQIGRLGHCAIGSDGEPDLPAAADPMPPGLTWPQRVDVMANRVSAGLAPTHPHDSNVFDVSGGMPINGDVYRSGAHKRSGRLSRGAMKSPVKLPFRPKSRPSSYNNY